MLASLNIHGETSIVAKKSRDHTELLFQNLKIPMKINKNRNYDTIKITKPKFINSFNLKIPGDISSSAFFIVLTLLTKNSKLLIKNINVNASRLGVIKILNKMGAKIKLLNRRKINNEKCADIFVKSVKNLRGINCPSNLNSSAIDEFLIIFLVAAKAKGISYFKNLSELNQKESPRLKIGSKILNMMGVKVVSNKDSIKIYGNPNLKLNKDYIIKNFLEDHRVFMMSVISALSLGGRWKIFDPDSVKTSFPSFLKIILKLGAKIN
jgi:3-phosphoshikimate 1-carboxyvinyltransferase